MRRPLSVLEAFFMGTGFIHPGHLSMIVLELYPIVVAAILWGYLGNHRTYCSGAIMYQQLILSGKADQNVCI